LRIVIIINIFTSIVVFSVGVYFIFVPVKIEPTTKILFGSIFIIYGIYRFINVLSKQRLLKQNEKIENIRTAQEKLFQDLKEHKKIDEKEL
jgi:uncharacterized membrane protein HdeD (DUF308 family)